VKKYFHEHLGGLPNCYFCAPSLIYTLFEIIFETTLIINLNKIKTLKWDAQAANKNLEIILTYQIQFLKGIEKAMTILTH
jgi:hypothetical protein